MLPVFSPFFIVFNLHNVLQFRFVCWDAHLSAWPTDNWQCHLCFIIEKQAHCHDTDCLKCKKRLVNLLAALAIVYGILERSKDLYIYLIY